MHKFLRYGNPALALLSSAVGGMLIYQEAMDFRGWTSIVVIVLWSLVLGIWFWNLAYAHYNAVYFRGRLDEAREIRDVFERVKKGKKGK